jgi:hypothetical protein
LSSFSGKIFRIFRNPYFSWGFFSIQSFQDRKKPRALEKIMREIGLILTTCVVGWTIAAGVGSVQEMRHWAQIDASAKKQAELSWSGPSNHLGVEVSPAVS